jgi:hypothetical protein
MAEARVAICGAVYPGIDGDCVCLTEPHSEDVVHRCDAPGCGREWTAKPLKPARKTA